MLRIARTEESNRFRRQYRRQNERTQQDFVLFVRELKEGQVKLWRRMRKMRGKLDIWEARIRPHGYRVTFHYLEEVATFRAIGSHDTAYGNT